MRAAAVAAAAAGVALAATACGGSPGSRVAQVGTTTPSGSSGAVAFAACMRSHRVPNWPDPSSGGTFDKSKLTPQLLGAGAAQVQAAQRACAHLLPNGGRPPDQAARQRVRAQALQYARCVRGHGVPGFPDPGSDGRIPDPASAGIDQGSPRFQAANEACGRWRPPYMPSNSAYDAYARTHGGS